MSCLKTLMNSWGIQANLDPLGNAMNALRDRAQKEGKDFGKKEASIFLTIMRRVSWKSAPSRDTIQAVYDRLYHEGRRWFMVRRGNSKTPEEELQRRFKARGTFARRWFVASVTNPSPWRIRILLVDKATYSSQIAERDGTIPKAQNIALGKWESKLNRLAHILTGRF